MYGPVRSTVNPLLAVVVVVATNYYTVIGWGMPVREPGLCLSVQVIMDQTMGMMATGLLLAPSWKASEKKTTVQGHPGRNAMQKPLASPQGPLSQSQSQSQNSLCPQGSLTLVPNALTLRQLQYGPWPHRPMLGKLPDMMKMVSCWTMKKRRLSRPWHLGRHPQPDLSQRLPNPPQNMIWPMTLLLPPRLEPVT